MLLVVIFTICLFYEHHLIHVILQQITCQCILQKLTINIINLFHLHTICKTSEYDQASHKIAPYMQSINTMHLNKNKVHQSLHVITKPAMTRCKEVQVHKPNPSEVLKTIFETQKGSFFNTKEKTTREAFLTQRNNNTLYILK